MTKLRERSLVRRLKAWASSILPVVCFHPPLPSLSVGESKESPFASRVVVRAFSPYCFARNGMVL